MDGLVLLTVTEKIQDSEVPLLCRIYLAYIVELFVEINKGATMN